MMDDGFVGWTGFFVKISLKLGKSETKLFEKTTELRTGLG